MLCRHPHPPNENRPYVSGTSHLTSLFSWRSQFSHKTPLLVRVNRTEHLFVLLPIHPSAHVSLWYSGAWPTGCGPGSFTMPVSWWKSQEFGSCPVHEAGCLNCHGLVLESRRIPRELLSVLESGHCSRIEPVRARARRLQTEASFFCVLV